MSVAAALILGSVLVAWASPTVLRRLVERGHDPLSVMICWVVSIAGVVGTFTAGVVLLMLPGDRLTGSAAADLAQGCWTTLGHGRLPELDEAIGMVGAVVLIAVAGRFVAGAARRGRAQRRIHRAHLNLLRMVGGAETGPTAVLWLDRVRPLAYSVGGRPGLVVATTGLRRLPAQQVAAVLCHERAHLRGRHHLLVSLAEALAVAVPVVPLFGRAPVAMRLLVELVADAAAVRRCGPPAVSAALVALDGGHGPEHALAMADRDVALRLRRIAGAHPGHRPVRLSLSRGFASIAPASLPALLGLGALVLAATVTCGLA